MTIERKVGMGIAGQPTGGAANVAEVFSTHLYTGNATARAITNGIDLAGEGGMVWVKRRNGTGYHRLYDTERTGGKAIFTNVTNAENNPTEISSFNSNGFSLTSGSDANINNYQLASWTFRKKEKFFTCLTFTANGSSNQTISHNLGSVPAMIITKKTNGTNNWWTYHKGLNNGTNPEQYFIELDGEGGGQGPNANFWNNTAPTDTQFTVGSAFNGTYVAYIFADNSSECGSYTGNGGTQQISLGWEPQFVMIKKTTDLGDWHIIDNIRGSYLEANKATAEQGALFTVGETISPNADGFYLEDGSALSNTNGAVYIWMAIRGEMMVEPEAATDVFAVDKNIATNSQLVSGFPVDMLILRENDANQWPFLVTRMTGQNYLDMSSTTAEGAGNYWPFDDMTGIKNKIVSGTNLSYMWKRAKGFMDVVCDKRAFQYGTLNHSLGVVPELIIKKDRSRANYWNVMPNVSPYDYRYTIYLNDTQAISGPSSAYWNSAPTDTVFGVNYSGDGSSNGDNFVFYLFATLAGISKVGSYTGNGSSQTISCGFSAGSRYVLIKRTDAAGDWYYWDSEQGIIAGNDPHLSLNQNAAQVTSDDSIDPANAGFIVNQVSATNINVSSATYIFYAIA